MATRISKKSKAHTSLKLRVARKGVSRLALRTKLQFLFSLLLIVSGILLVSYVSVANLDLKRDQVVVGSDQEKQQVNYSRIKSISIPKIKKDLIVEDGSFTGGRWEVSKNGVSFYTQSSLPEAGGNTVLYGHNKARILGGLVSVKKGDEIKLSLDSGKELKYEVVETKTIKAAEVGILDQTSEPRLTIYTCTGFLDSARFVVVAKLATSD